MLGNVQLDSKRIFCCHGNVKDINAWCFVIDRIDEIFFVLQLEGYEVRDIDELIHQCANDVRNISQGRVDRSPSKNKSKSG